MLRDFQNNGIVPHRLPTEDQLARRYGVSRATIRKVLGHLRTCGVLKISGHTKMVVRLPRNSDFYAVDETSPKPRERVLDHLVPRLCRFKEQNKTVLSEAELARELNCDRQIIREELARISYYGLIVNNRRGAGRSPSSSRNC